VPSLPLTPEEEKKAFQTIGIQSFDDLIATIPPKIRESARFQLDFGPEYNNLSSGLTEHELRDYFVSLSAENKASPDTVHFLGGGIYDNIIPAIVNQLVLRGEFLTCYTPYQPEISQGTLQAIFEFQTMMCRMTGMPLSNASMYDGPTATAEAVLMAQRLSRNSNSVLLAANLSPEYRTVIRTFLSGHETQIGEVLFNEDGLLDMNHLSKLMQTVDPCALVVSYPNYFGSLEDLAAIKKQLPDSCLLIVAVPDPSALSIFEPPGSFGADIVVGEAQQLGTPMLFGGPHVGFFTTRKEYLRQLPGRIVGETQDSRGERCYTLTLSTREQHIRRDKATSNICTNQGLIALRTTIYLSFLGKHGFQNLGESNYSLFEYLKAQLSARQIPLKFSGAPYYREGVFEVPKLAERFEKCLAKNIVPGIRLRDKFGPAFENSLLITVNPKHNRQQLDLLCEVLGS
jgi:glycine dehydrogenase subunit 1